MFTGIIEDVGKVSEMSSSMLSVETNLDGIKPGDSVSVNGICLTVTKIFPKMLNFDFSPETSSATNISKLKRGDNVNLERALKIGDRLGGHFVTGHVEATGKILSRSSKGNSVLLEISSPPALAKYIVGRGSVAIDGVSLTVANVGGGYFAVTIIPYTSDKTTLKFKKTGDFVNIETDVIAKYAESVFNESQKSSLTVDKLKNAGFL